MVQATSKVEVPTEDLWPYRNNSSLLTWRTPGDLRQMLATAQILGDLDLDVSLFTNFFLPRGHFAARIGIKFLWCNVKLLWFSLCTHHCLSASVSFLETKVWCHSVSPTLNFSLGSTFQLGIYILSFIRHNHQTITSLKYKPDHASCWLKTF